MLGVKGVRGDELAIRGWVVGGRCEGCWALGVGW